MSAVEQEAAEREAIAAHDQCRRTHRAAADNPGDYYLQAVYKDASRACEKARRRLVGLAVCPFCISNHVPAELDYSDLCEFHTQRVLEGWQP